MKTRKPPSEKGGFVPPAARLPAKLARMDIRQTDLSLRGAAVLLAGIAAFGVAAFSSLALLPLLVLAWRIAPDRLTFILAYQTFILVLFPDLGAGFARHGGNEGLVDAIGGQVLVGGWALILALPGLCCFRWRAESSFRKRMIGAVVAWIAAPLAIAPLVVLHPIAAAGEYFPGAGYWGLLFTALCLVGLAALPARAAIGLVSIGATVALFLNVLIETPRTDSSIVGVGLAIGRPAAKQAELAKQIFSATRAVERALGGGANVVILPELFARQSDGSLNAWDQEAGRLASKYRAAIWTGAEFDFQGELLNIAAVHGGVAPPVAAQVPLPFILWKPWRGLPPTFWDVPHWRELPRGGNIGFLFCYESISLATWLERPRRPEGPATLAFISSQWWTVSSRVGSVLDTSARSMAKLMGVGYVTAVSR